MDILVYIILGVVIGICVGNTNIRNRIGQEIRTILTQDHSEKVVKDCPLKKVKYKASYKPPASQQEPPKSGGCNKCGGPVEVIDKMPGYFFCTSCNSITSKKKTEAK